jgi:hypothetical protein
VCAGPYCSSGPCCVVYSNLQQLKGHQDATMVAKRKKVIIANINHAVSVSTLPVVLCCVSLVYGC